MTKADPVTAQPISMPRSRRSPITRVWNVTISAWREKRKGARVEDEDGALLVRRALSAEHTLQSKMGV